MAALDSRNSGRFLSDDWFETDEQKDIVQAQLHASERKELLGALAALGHRVPEVEAPSNDSLQGLLWHLEALAEEARIEAFESRHDHLIAAFESEQTVEEAERLRRHLATRYAHRNPRPSRRRAIRNMRKHLMQELGTKPRRLNAPHDKLIEARGARRDRETDREDAFNALDTTACREEDYLARRYADEIQGLDLNDERVEGEINAFAYLELFERMTKSSDEEDDGIPSGWRDEHKELGWNVGYEIAVMSHGWDLERLQDTTDLDGPAWERYYSLAPRARDIFADDEDYGVCTCLFCSGRQFNWSAQSDSDDEHDRDQEMNDGHSSTEGDVDQFSIDGSPQEEAFLDAIDLGCPVAHERELIAHHFDPRLRKRHSTPAGQPENP